MSIAKRIIDKFGGPSALARELGHSGRTTVASWADRGFIPAQQQQDVLHAAARMGIDLTPDDFFDHVPNMDPDNSTVDSHRRAQKIAGAA